MIGTKLPAMKEMNKLHLFRVGSSVYVPGYTSRALMLWSLSPARRLIMDTETPNILVGISDSIPCGSVCRDVIVELQVLVHPRP